MPWSGTPISLRVMLLTVTGAKRLLQILYLLQYFYFIIYWHNILNK
jgi:hypothetical protein